MKKRAAINSACRALVARCGRCHHSDRDKSRIDLRESKSGKMSEQLLKHYEDIGSTGVTNGRGGSAASAGFVELLDFGIGGFDRGG